MDIVQISHLRSFANAVASALQSSTDHSSIHAAQMHEMLAAVDRSVAASNFMIGEDKQESSMTSAVPLPVASALSVPILATKSPPVAPQISAVPKSQSENVSAAARVTLPTPFEKRIENKAKQLQLSAEMASRFFVQIPWGGHAVEVALDTATPKNQVVADVLSKTTAMGYFALLPWSSAKIGTLSVGTADDNLASTQALQKRLGQTAIPAFITHALPSAALNTATHASGFFATVPWTGQRKNDD